MAQGSLPQEYARAVYALALERWQRSLQAVQQKLAASPDLLTQLENGQSPFGERQKSLDAILPDGLSEQERKFFYTLLQNGHLRNLGQIATGLGRLAAKGPGVEVATVTTAVALNEEEKERFRRKLSASYGDTLELEFQVEPEILGGVVVQVGDKIIDGSVANQLNAAREKLTAAV